MFLDTDLLRSIEENIRIMYVNCYLKICSGIYLYEPYISYVVNEIY